MELTMDRDELEEILERHQRPLLDRLDLLTTLLTGSASPEKGIVLRLDRIEQAEKRRVWIIRSVIGACITAFLSSLAALFGK